MAKIKITLSERRPVEIDTDAWTLIAEASTFSGAETFIRVREHEDGRRIVYGALQAGPGGMPAHWREVHAGFLVEAAPADDRHPVGGKPDETETVRAIRRVCGVVGMGNDELGSACVADLPPEELS